MKCPKCGFNSFEYYDSCKKCSSDLIGYKQTYSVTSLVLPLEAKEKFAAEYRSAEGTTRQSSEAAESHDDIFSFDLPEEPQTASAQPDANPFDFGEPAPAAKQSGGSTFEDDAFADLLESTSQTDESPFAAAKDAAPAAPKTESVASEPGEFDLGSFSWDDTTDTQAAPGSTETADDFDSLFGDTKENNSK